jgi:hypothetical protein
MLREAYAIAIDEVESAEPSYAGQLGDHLTWLSFYGAIDLEKDDTPLRSFIEHASAAARHDALDGIGRAAYNSNEALDEQVLDRLRKFWEWWADLVIARGDGAELRTYGWWFASQHFDRAWALPMLDRVLGVTRGSIDWDHEVTEKLASLATEAPEQVATCLAKLVDAPDDRAVLYNRKQIRTILEALMQTTAASSARAVASRLVARGSLEFRDLA